MVMLPISLPIFEAIATVGNKFVSVHVVHECVVFSWLGPVFAAPSPTYCVLHSIRRECVT